MRKLTPFLFSIAFSMLLTTKTQSQVTVSGGFEGSNVINVEEVSANNFTCMLTTPPMPTPASFFTGGDHYHGWFMLKIEGAAGQAVTVTITNADWGPFNRADGKCVYSEAIDPYALSTDTTWKKITDGSWSNPNFTFNLTPTTDLAWVALGYPSTPTHTNNWITAHSVSPFVTAETVATTSQGRPVQMVFVTDPAYPLSGKKGVLVYGHEHNQEPTGGWTCQGLVDYLTSGDVVAQNLLQNVVFVVVPDMNPDATAAGLDQDPDDGKMAQWRYNPAQIDRLMPGMVTPMTEQSKGILNRVIDFVNNDGGQINFSFNIHQGGNANFWGVYEDADPQADNFDGYLRGNMPTNGAPWVPNANEGYSTGTWDDVLPNSWPSLRLVGRCWEEWRTTAMGYEIAHGAGPTTFLNEVRGIKYFGEAIARSIDEYYGSFNSTITITSPNGGNLLGSGASETITWSSTGSVTNVRIDCSVDGGSTFTNLLSSTPNDGSQSVTLPGVNSNSCIIRISDVTALGITDESDNMFTIGTPPTGTITVTSPNNGELWDANWKNTVTWTSTGSIPNVTIEVSADNGATWKRLSWATPNNGSYIVNVPNSLSSQCLVRVIGVENNTVSDVSDANFTIQPETPWPTLEVTYPNGGEYLLPGDTATILWASTGVVSNIGISLSMDEGATWSTITAGTTNDGNELITLPGSSSSKCLISIWDANPDPVMGVADKDPLDKSDGVFAIDVPPPPVIVIDSVNYSQISCNGADDGGITIYSTNGTPPFEFSVDGGNTFQNDSIFTDLVPDDYEIVVRDVNYTIYDDTITIVEPAPVIVNLGNDTIICAINSVVLDAGTGFDTYLWSTGDGTSSITADTNGIGTGTFIYWTEVSYNGCSDRDSVIVTFDPCVDLSIVIDTILYSNITCYGDDNGSITIIDETVDNPSLEYSIDGGNNFQINDSVFVNLIPGEYQIVVRNTNDTVYSDTITLTEPPPVIASLGNDTIICADNSVVLDVGASFNSYLWSTGDITSSITADSNGIGIGTEVYWVEVTYNGCSNRDSINITFDPCINTNIVIDTIIFSQITCNGANDGSITIIDISEANPSLQYSIDGGNNFQTNDSVFTNLIPGEYQVVVRNINDTVYSDTITLTDPPPVIVDLGDDSITCAVNSVVLDASMGFDSYLWSTGDATPTISADTTDEGLGAITYWVEVTDNSCIGRDTIIITFDPCADTNIVIDTIIYSHISCNGANDGNITIDISVGNPPIQYSIDGGLTFQTNNNQFNDLLPGDYPTLVRNINDTVFSDTISLIEPRAIIFDLGNDTTICQQTSIELDATVDFNNAAYFWHDGSIGKSIIINSSVIGEVNYWVEVSDTNNCSQSDTITITYDLCLSIKDISKEINLNVFPNPSNGIFTVSINGANELVDLKIINLQGQTIYTNSNCMNCTKQIDLSAYPNGMYFLQVKSNDIVSISKLVFK